jgi:hypothetical protein
LVNVFVGEELAHVVVALGLFAGEFFGGGLAGFEGGLVDVAERCDAGVGEGGVALDVIVPASADAYDTDVDFSLAPSTRPREMRHWPP